MKLRSKAKAPCAKGSHPWRVSSPGWLQYRPTPQPAPGRMTPTPTPQVR